MSTASDRRLPKSGNAALVAGALIQAVLGIEFLLTGLSKVADIHYQTHFRSFVMASPGAHQGAIAPLIQSFVLPHLAVAAQVAKFSELAIGATLLVAAAETARRRFSGRLAGQLPYEPAVAVAGGIAGLGLAAISLTIFLLQGGVLPTVNPAKAFASAIPVELMMVALGLAMAWLEFGRYRALTKSRSLSPTATRLHRDFPNPFVASLNPLLPKARARSQTSVRPSHCRRVRLDRPRRLHPEAYSAVVSHENAEGVS